MILRIRLNEDNDGGEGCSVSNPPTSLINDDKDDDNDDDNDDVNDNGNDND